MLVFVDESGDAGRKTGSGSSSFFVVTTVVFPSRDAAQDCDDGIASLRTEMGFPGHKEFHFTKDRDEVRRRFLSYVSAFNFYYASLVVEKDALTGLGFPFKDSLYKFAVKLAIENIMPSLKDAIVVFDRCGSREFTQQLKVFLRQRTKAGHAADLHPIRKVRCDKSSGNNLLQMADMICGAVARCFSSHKADRGSYRTLIRTREFLVQVWP